jgi:hypothetical protein
MPTGLGRWATIEIKVIEERLTGEATLRETWRVSMACHRRPDRKWLVERKTQISSHCANKSCLWVILSLSRDHFSLQEAYSFLNNLYYYFHCKKRHFVHYCFHLCDQTHTVGMMRTEAVQYVASCSCQAVMAPVICRVS